MKALHARIEIDQADRDAGDADDGQVRLVAFAFDEFTLLDVDVERVGKDVNGVEADLLSHANSVRCFASGLGPGGIDEAEFHGEVPPGSSYCSGVGFCFMI